MNMQNLMAQAQRMQREITAKKEALEKMEFVGKSEWIEMTFNGARQILNVKIIKEGNIDGDDKEILEDMIILGIVNHVLSGQEYAGVQRNYVHYLSGVNLGANDYMTQKLIMLPAQDEENITNISKLLVVFGNLCQS